MLTNSHSPAFCDTFFDNVVVPKQNLVGPLDDGWTLAKALLGHERTLVGAVGLVRRWVRLAREIARPGDQRNFDILPRQLNLDLVGRRGDGAALVLQPAIDEHFDPVDLQAGRRTQFVAQGDFVV